MDNKHILKQLPDNDLWGLYCALAHSLQDGYANDNKKWTNQMMDDIEAARIINNTGKYKE